MCQNPPKLVLVRRQLVLAGHYHPAPRSVVPIFRVAGGAAERTLDPVLAELCLEATLWQVLCNGAFINPRPRQLIFDLLLQLVRLLPSCVTPSLCWSSSELPSC